jgi:RNA polymerase sigma-70 factor (ECF subfamily)
MNHDSESERVSSDNSCAPPLASRVEITQDKSVAASALLEIAPAKAPLKPRARENEELVERIRTDPAGAAPLVYARFAPTVNRIVWRLLGGDPDHNDVVQQVFYRVLRQIPRLREPDKIESWVQRIAANTVYELLRRRQVRRLFLKELPTEIHADLVREVEVRDLLIRTKAVVDRLPAKERLLFMLYYVEGRTLAEVAELGGYSLATAKRKVSRASRRFQYLLSKNPELLRLFRGEEEEEA